MKKESISLDVIENTVKQMLDILDTVKDIPPFNTRQLDLCRSECELIPDHIQEGYLKIAVAGVIKSGKSTLVNSMVKKELVQRGAGVVTSITTRIRKGNKNIARLFFKSWDQINSQLQQILQMFPDDGIQALCDKGFDLRRKTDRHQLEKVYQSLVEAFPFAYQENHPELLSIKYALAGFDVCKDLVRADERTLCFSSRQFNRHKDFTSDPNRAFYVKDVCLDVFGKAIDPHIEIADCQGADSTDPAQLGQVLRYLESSNLILYCISSRTGLRQSDLQFLNQIKHLGRLDNMIFVMNCDLSEHESLADLIKVETATRQILENLKITPQVFSVSALYNLFSAQLPKIKKKDKARMDLWQTEKKLVEYCTQKTLEFNEYYKRMIEKDSYRLLISNHVNRLRMIINQLNGQADMALGLLSSDKEKQDQTILKLEKIYQNSSRLETIVTHSLDSIVTDLTGEINQNIGAMFDQDDQDILKAAQDFVKNMPVDVEKYRSAKNDFGFNKILYLLFQDLKRGLDLYVIQVVQPKLNQFVKSEQLRIASFFKSVFESYRIDLFEMGHGRQSIPDISEDHIDIDKIIKILGLELPENIFKAVYTSKTRLNVFTDFGLHAFFHILGAVYKKKDTVSFTPSLEKAVSKIKQQTARELANQFRAYQAQLQNNYFIPLIDAAIRDFKGKITRQFHQYDVYKQEADGQILLNQSLKEEQKIKIEDMKNWIQRTVKEIDSIGEISSK